MENDTSWSYWSYVYGCPSCGRTLVRTMKESAVTCGNCGASMVMQSVYICPECNKSVYAHKRDTLICGSCMVPMEEVTD